MRKLLAVLVVVALVLGLVGTTSAAAPTTVYLVNTLGLVFDVYVDGNLIIEDFVPDSIRGPFTGESSGEIRLEMIRANTVLGEEDPNVLQYPTLVTTLPAGKTIAIITEVDNIPGSLGSLDMFIYDFAPTGPGQSRLKLHNAMYGDSIHIVLFPGTANEEELQLFYPDFQARLPAGPKIASVSVWGRNPLPDVFGPFTADLKPGILYVVFMYRKRDDLRMLTQEFNVGQ